MKNEEILNALRRLKVETGSLVCMGCGREHDCGIHGCRIVREASELIEKLTDRCARYAEEIAVLQEREKRVRGDRDTTVRLLLALEDLTGLTFRELFGECEERQ